MAELEAPRLRHFSACVSRQAVRELALDDAAPFLPPVKTKRGKRPLTKPRPRRRPGLRVELRNRRLPIQARHCCGHADVVDMPNPPNSPQSMNHVESHPGTLNHVPASIRPYGLADEHTAWQENSNG